MKQISLFKKIPHFKKCNKQYTKWSAEYFQNVVRHKHIFPVFYLSRGFLHGGATGDIPLKQLGNAIASGSSSTLTLSSLVTKKYLMVEIYCIASGSSVGSIRFNNDSASNYAFRYSINGGAGSTATSSSSFDTGENSTTTGHFVRMFVINTSANEKLVIVHSVDAQTAGAGNAPSRTEIFAKWANTSTQINEVDLIVNGSGNWSSTTTMTVYGSD